jgi:hypothetical protein
VTLLDLPLLTVEQYPFLPRLLAMCVRLPAHQDQQVGCLWWCGAQSRGGQKTHSQAPYGSLNLGAAYACRTVRTHVAMATAMGLITDFLVPAGLQLDHLCRRSLCVEPTHLELVTAQVNNERKALPPRPLTDQEVELISLRHLKQAPWWWPDRLRAR